MIRKQIASWILVQQRMQRIVWLPAPILVAELSPAPLHSHDPSKVLRRSKAKDQPRMGSDKSRTVTRYLTYRLVLGAIRCRIDRGQVHAWQTAKEESQSIFYLISVGANPTQVTAIRSTLQPIFNKTGSPVLYDSMRRRGQGRLTGADAPNRQGLSRSARRIKKLIAMIHNCNLLTSYSVQAND